MTQEEFHGVFESFWVSFEVTFFVLMICFVFTQT